MTKDAIYLSDRGGGQVRLIRRSAETQVSFHADAEIADYADSRREEIGRIMEQQEQVAPLVNRAVGFVTRSQLHKLITRIEENREHIQYIYNQYLIHSDVAGLPKREHVVQWRAAIKLQLLATSEYARLVRESEGLHRNLTTTLVECGVSEIIEERQSSLAALLSINTLPLEDTEVWSDPAAIDEIIAYAKAQRPSDVMATREAYQSVAENPPLVESGVSDSVAGNIENVIDSQLPEPDTIAQPWKRNLRIYAAGSRIAAGVMAAATNLTLGVTYGSYAAVPAISPSAWVPVGLGVLTSIWVGQTHVSGGLKEWTEVDD